MIYIPVLLLILYCIVRYDITGKSKKISLPYSIILVYLVLISGFAYHIGGDGIVFENEYPQYLSLFDSRISFGYFFGFQNRMPGWVLLNTICKTFSSSWVLFKLVHAILLNTLILGFIKKNCRYVFTTILFYFILLYFNFNFQYMRSSVAVSLFLFSLQYYFANKWFKYYVFCALAFSFHDSAIIALFMPLVKIWDYSMKHLAILGTAAFLLIVFRDLLIERTLTLFTNEYVAMRVNYYVSQYETGTAFSLYLNLCFNIVVPISLMFMLKKRHADNKLTVLSLAYMAVYTLSMVFPIAFRMNTFYILFYYILIIDSLGLLFLNNYKRKAVSMYLFLCLAFILFKGRTYLTNYGRTNVPTYVQFYPYSSIIDQTRYPDREKILEDAQTGIWVER